MKKLRIALNPIKVKRKIEAVNGIVTRITDNKNHQPSSKGKSLGLCGSHTIWACEFNDTSPINYRRIDIFIVGSKSKAAIPIQIVYICEDFIKRFARVYWF